jgi:hypothetical protein
MYSQQSKEICKNNKYDKKLTSGNVYKFMWNELLIWYQGCKSLLHVIVQTKKMENSTFELNENLRLFSKIYFTIQICLQIQNMNFWIFFNWRFDCLIFWKEILRMNSTICLNSVVFLANK